ncbi:LytTR family DNA-binding domain-containing protein [Phaeovulum sp. W22_SRMD_FR3]
MIALLAFSLFAVGSGPFETIHILSFEQRLLYWPAILGLGLFLGTLVRAVLIVLIGHWPYWALSFACASLISVLFAPLLWFLVRSFAPPLFAELLPPLWHIGLYTWVASLWVSSLRQVIAPAAPVAAPPASAAPPVEGSLPEPVAAEETARAAALPGAALLARLDPADRAPLLRFSGRDHYIDVVTEAGNTRLLLRFSDALALLEPEAGMQVHRSHWVAHAAVQGVVRRSGRLFLILADGGEVPVSRPYQEAVVQQGYPTADSGTAKARRPVSTASASAPNRAENSGSRTDSPPV